MNHTISWAKKNKSIEQEIGSEQNSKVTNTSFCVSRKYQRKVKACERRERRKFLEEETHRKLLEDIEGKDKDKRSKWIVSRKKLRETPTIVT